MEEMKVQNVVARVDLYVRVPLEKAAIELPNTIYNPEEFPGLIIRLNPEEEKPSKTALVFSSGRVVITGAKDEKDVEKAIERLVKLLEKIGVKVTKKPTYEIQNIVVSGNLNMRLNLNNLIFKLENAEYEPEQFPGLIYKIYPDKSITFLLFGSGRFVCTGGRRIEEIKKAIKDLKKKLEEIEKG